MTLVIMTYGVERFAHTPLNKIARPYGTPARSRYKQEWCTKEAIDEIQSGYTGEAYYFLHVRKNRENLFLPLRRIRVSETSLLNGKVSISYNLLEYARPREGQNGKSIFERFDGAFEKEEKLVFVASETAIASMVEIGSMIDDWQKMINYVKDAVRGTNIMDANNRIPLFVGTFLTEGQSAQVIKHEERKGIELTGGSSYRLSILVDMPEVEKANFPVSVKLFSDEDLINKIVGKDTFVTEYDQPDLYFSTRKRSTTAHTTLKTELLPREAEGTKSFVLPSRLYFNVFIKPGSGHYVLVLLAIVGMFLAGFSSSIPLEPVIKGLISVLGSILSIGSLQRLLGR
ncbi:MAG: hypothetical protein ACFFCW_09980 [Candidatus Hodarchaeota archaeon]